MKNRIFRKVTLATGTCGYWEIVDVTELYHDMGDDAEEYFAPGEYDSTCTSGYAYGFIESLGQSDMCPPILWEEDIIKIIVEDVYYGFNYRRDADNKYVKCQ